ncbi:MAG: 2,3-diaminopropionate biosynthesis protein SbnB [Gammaproteobacteria bacterium]|nr:2,3-diaminopropionate biosynthesis protein SbnB [Gammaproteobacteria bacterium]
MSSKDVLIIGAPEVEAALEGREDAVLDAVKKAYETHSSGASSLPHSSFLRFPDSDKDRIICLPAYLGADYQLAGVKWIASMPDNLSRGLERASATMILNDRVTGRPKSVVEGSIISKQRTAASAALASKVLAPGEPESIAFVGCGPINTAVAQFLFAVWPGVKRFVAFDLDPARAAAFGESLIAIRPGAEFRVADDMQDLLGSSPMIAFGTTSIKPYVDSLDACQPGATVLHVSLRDLAADIILSNHNIVDDLDHVNRAATSIHLASEKAGHTDFVHADIGEILLGKKSLPERDERKMIFSPFGLGVLDLAVADLVTDTVAKEGGGTLVKSFLP